MEGELTWVANGTATFESDWIALHRFLWMNAFTGATFWRASTNRVRADPLNHIGTAEAFRQVIEANPAASEFAVHLRRRSLRSCFGEGNGRELERASFVRFCQTCLENCFHSPVFQLASVGRCPFHDEPLRTLCPHCAKPIGKPLTKIELFMTPLACASCKQAFVPNERAHVVFEGFPAGWRTFRRTERLLTAFRRVQFVKREALGGFPFFGADYSTLCDALTLLATGTSRRLRVPVSESAFTVLSRRDLADKSAREWFALRRYSAPLSEDVEAVCASVKSLGRYLSKCVTQICGHRKTNELRWERALRPFERVQPILVVAPEDCPACATLDRWRAYAGKLIALRGTCRGLHPLCPYDVTLHEGFRFKFSLEPGACLEALISSFAWFAVATLRAIQLRRSEPSDFPYSGDADLAREASRHPCIPMDLHRFEVTPHVFVFRTPREVISVAYSLGFALESLRKSVALRSSDGMWPTPQRQGVSVAPPTRDHWYLDISEHLLSRKGADPFGKAAGRLPDWELQQELFPLDDSDRQERLWSLWFQHHPSS